MFRLLSALSFLLCCSPLIAQDDWDKASLGFECRDVTTYRHQHTPVLMLRATYVASDWLFVEKLLFKIDGQTTSLPVAMERDNESGIWEWTTVPAAPHAALIRAIEKSNQAITVRYSGDKYSKDLELSLQELAAIHGVLKAFEAMGEKL